MKKKIFYTALFSVLTLSSIYAQNKPKKGTQATPITCTSDDPLHPIVGKTYTYTAQGSTSAGKYHFFATKDKEFVKNGVVTTNLYANETDIKTTSVYNDANNTTKSITVAWSGSVVSPSFLVVKYTNTEADKCLTDNLKVWKITPKNAFTFEFRNTDKNSGSVATETTSNTCFANVESAVYSETIDKVVYDYGTQSLYFELIVANYDKTFTPSFKVVGLDANQKATLKYGFTKGNFNEGSIDVPASGIVTLTSITADENAIPAEGVSVYVQLEIKNGTFEGLANQTITLQADAVTGKNNAKDVKITDCDTEQTDFGTQISQIIKARPDITEVSTGTFIPKL